MSQPETPLTADALRVGETATRYEGDPVVTRIDSDGDGRVDRVEVDLDADGDAEIIERDTDGDGAVDDSHVDLDGRSNVVGFGDQDGDGHYETILRDTDGDGRADREDLDLDGDHVADRFGYGLDEADPFGGPTYAADRFPEPREGITEPLVDAPLGPDALDGFGSGAGSGADEREMDYEQEAVNEFADTLQDTPTTAVVDPAPPYEPPAEEVDDSSAAPVFAPVAEASDVDDAMAQPDDDYVG
jgi:hypothetical protein